MDRLKGLGLTGWDRYNRFVPLPLFPCAPTATPPRLQIFVRDLSKPLGLPPSSRGWPHYWISVSQKVFMRPSIAVRWAELPIPPNFFSRYYCFSSGTVFQTQKRKNRFMNAKVFKNFLGLGRKTPFLMKAPLGNSVTNWRLAWRTSPSLRKWAGSSQLME